MATSTANARIDGSTPRSRRNPVAGVMTDAAATAASAAGEAAARVPEAVAGARAAFDDANRRIQAGTDEVITVGAAMSFGLAVGLLIGGASRLLVAAALVPVAMMGFALLDRASQGRLGNKGGTRTGL